MDAKLETPIYITLRKMNGLHLVFFDLRVNNNKQIDMIIAEQRHAQAAEIAPF